MNTIHFVYHHCFHGINKRIKHNTYPFPSAPLVILYKRHSVFFLFSLLHYVIFMAPIHVNAFLIHAFLPFVYSCSLHTPKGTMKNIWAEWKMTGTRNAIITRRSCAWLMIAHYVWMRISCESEAFSDCLWFFFSVMIAFFGFLNHKKKKKQWTQ